MQLHNYVLAKSLAGRRPRRQQGLTCPNQGTRPRPICYAAISAPGRLSFPPNLGGLVYAALACSYSTGESMPALEWRRWRLYHWSIQAATSRRAWWRVA